MKATVEWYVAGGSQDVPPNYIQAPAALPF